MAGKRGCSLLRSGTTNGGRPEGENDLKEFSIDLQPSDIYEGTVKIWRTNTKARVWSDSEKGSSNAVVINSTYKLWNLSDESERGDFNDKKSHLFVEGYLNVGNTLLTAEFRPPEGAILDYDRVKTNFIAATCGWQPKPFERATASAVWENLIHCEWSITDGETPAYNCIGWSVGSTSAWYVDIEGHRMHSYDIVIDAYPWGDSNGEMSMEELDAFYYYWGYSRTGTCPADSDVMYYTGFHGARRNNCSCGSGKWIMYESKCGEEFRIEHVDDQLNGASYGYPIRFYNHY